jgi:hypothetical protein
MIRVNTLAGYGRREQVGVRPEWLRLRETLDEGMRLFHAGDRVLAVPALEAVLGSAVHVPSFRLAAAGLLAETYRGQSEFALAGQLYLLAMQEADAIPAAERPRNEWYLHYRPRVQLGLITALRRAVDEDHERLQRLLREARDRFAGAGAGDVMAQLNAVEGMYLRQCGDLAGAVDRLGLARDAMARMDPPFTFLDPDHLEALLLQVRLLMPGARVLMARAARGLLAAADAGPWSKAVAAAALLHVQLGRMTREGAAPPVFSEALDDTSSQGAGHLISVLEANSTAERDPLLITEATTLRAAWLGASGRTAAMHAQVELLAREMAGAASGTILLRAVEATQIASAFARPGEAAGAALEEVRGCGLRALAELERGIASYRHGVVALAHDHLRPGRAAAGDRRIDWLGEPLSCFRALLWP